MTQKYRAEQVVHAFAPLDSHWTHACEMREKYGLFPFYSVFEVQVLWERFSMSLACGWAGDSPELIERVFGVNLTPLEPKP